MKLYDNSILAFCLRNDALEPSFCEPWHTPMVIRSTDQGESWSEPVECIPYRGRIYDALYHKGVVYVYIFCNEHFLGTAPEHQYRVYKSYDNGLMETVNTAARAEVVEAVMKAERNNG